MVSRLIHSLSGIWSKDIEEKQSNTSSVDLDEELSSSHDLHDEKVKDHFDKEEDDNIVTPPIAASAELQNELSFDKENSEDDIAGKKDEDATETPAVPTPPVVFGHGGVTGVHSIGRREERSRSPMARVPCEIASSSGQLFRGGRTDNSDFATRRNDQRAITATERMVYEMSEMQPNFVPRPTTTPDQFRRLSFINGTRSKSPQRREHSRSPSFNTKQRLRTDSEHLKFRFAPEFQPYASPLQRPQVEDSKFFNPIAESRSSSVLQDLNDRVNEIIAEEDEEFREKYSQWIAQLFHSQLSKMKRKLSQQFSAKLEEIISDKEHEVLSLNQRFQDKAMSFDEASEKFQKWVDALEDENSLLVESKDVAISNMQLRLREMEKKFESELIQQRMTLLAEAETEREKLVSEHKHSLEKLIESSKSLGQDTSARRKVESLHRLATSLQNKNDALKRQLQETMENNSKEVMMSTSSKNWKDAASEIKSLMKTIDELRKRLSDTERERTALIEFHADELMSLKKSFEKATVDAGKRVHKLQDSVRLLKEKHEREVKDLKMSMLNQETKYNKTFTDLKHKYGNKIESLTKVIDKIQCDLSI